MAKVRQLDNDSNAYSLAQDAKEELDTAFTEFEEAVTPREQATALVHLSTSAILLLEKAAEFTAEFIEKDTREVVQEELDEDGI